jgi:hypothetical protein
MMMKFEINQYVINLEDFMAVKSGECGQIIKCRKNHVYLVQFADGRITRSADQLLDVAELYRRSKQMAEKPITTQADMRAALTEHFSRYIEWLIRSIADSRADFDTLSGDYTKERPVPVGSLVTIDGQDYNGVVVSYDINNVCHVCWLKWQTESFISPVFDLEELIVLESPADWHYPLELDIADKKRIALHEQGERVEMLAMPATYSNYHTMHMIAAILNNR